VAALSPGAFSRYFKSRTGKTLPEYVNELRIGRACRMLAETDAAVTDVAFDCGFRNLANFNRWFLKLPTWCRVPTARRCCRLAAELLRHGANIFSHCETCFLF